MPLSGRYVLPGWIDMHAHVLGAPWGADGTIQAAPRPATTERLLRLLLALTRRLWQGGVRLTAGTDTPTPWIVPGASYHRELLLLHDAGLPNAEVLRFGSRDAAAALGKEHEIGAVAPGWRADIVVLRQNPLDDLHNTRSIEWVIQAGHLYRLAELLQARD